MRGIFSSRAINRTDHKAPSIGEFINLVRRSYKSPTFLVDIQHQPHGAAHVHPLLGSRQPVFRNDSDAPDRREQRPRCLHHAGYRVPNTNAGSLITVPQYNETITLKNPFGTLSASTYSDSGTTFETTPSETYPILNGTGRYAYAKFLTIFFNSVAKTRVVKIFAYSPL